MESHRHSKLVRKSPREVVSEVKQIQDTEPNNINGIVNKLIASECSGVQCGGGCDSIQMKLSPR